MADRADDNPYQAPQPAGIERSPTTYPPRSSWLRGLAWSVPSALCGASVPVLMIQSGLTRAILADTPEAIAACALVFALAAILNFVPAQRLGFVRSLLFVGGVAIGAVLIVGFIYMLGPRRMRGEPLGPWEFVAMGVEACILMGYALAHTLHRTGSWRVRVPKATAASHEKSGGMFKNME